MPLSWVTVVWSMIAASCLTLAAIYFLVWLRNRDEPAQFFFALNAVSMVAFAFCEMWIMRVESPAEAIIALRWAHVALMAWLLTNVWFVKAYLRTGRAWLAWTILIMRFLLLPFNFVPGQNLTFREVLSLEHVPFLGETVTVLNGAVNPLQLLTQATVVMILIFIADASRTAWRQGERRKAVVVGASVEFTIMAAVANAMPAIFGLVRAPFMFSIPYMGLVLVMAYELSRDVLRASQLVRDLRLSEGVLRENQQRLEASNQQISSLFGRLIAAQETERTRIARDLHDEIAQRIAGISIAMSGLKRKLEADESTVAALAAMQRETAALADGVRHVSHDLHPTLLQHSGLVEALRVVCSQFQQRHGIAVAYRAEANLDSLPHDAALAFYRVAQEALYNISKHAGASHIDVGLTQIADGVQLSIADDGKGFNLAATRARADGLGLVSIDERVRLLKGRADIDSAPGGGTRLLVQIPVAPLT